RAGVLPDIYATAQEPARLVGDIAAGAQVDGLPNGPYDRGGIDDRAAGAADFDTVFGARDCRARRAAQPVRDVTAGFEHNALVAARSDRPAVGDGTAAEDPDAVAAGDRPRALVADD